MPGESNGNGSLPAESAPESGSDAAQNGSHIGRRLSGFADPSYWTQERREAQRQLAKKLYQEGRLGGKQPGAGRPRKQSVSEVVSEAASKNADLIARELISMVKHPAPSIKLGAIDRIEKLDQNYQKNMRDDEKEILKLSGKSLDDEVSRVLAEHGISYDYELNPDDVEEVVSNGDN